MVAPAQLPQNSLGVRVVTHDPNVQVVVVVEDPDFGPFTRRSSFIRKRLNELVEDRRGPPLRLIQFPVNGRGLANASC